MSLTMFKRGDTSRAWVPCPTQCNPHYDGFCARCFAYQFPTDPRAGRIRQNSHELRWINALLSAERIATDVSTGTPRQWRSGCRPK